MGYDFKSGKVQLGRLMPFNRWIMGSIDGASVSYKISDMFKLHVLGGLNVRYGKLYDSDNNYSVGYAELRFRSKQYGGKFKFYNDEDVSKSGFDVYGRINKLRIATNFGYDLSNERISDGGLNLSYMVNRDFNVSGNYRLFRSDDWKLIKIDFEGYLIERFMIGCNYKIFKGYSIDFRQMLSMTSEKKDYVSFFTFKGKYFHIGANYLTGDSEYQRMGFSVGGNYSPLNGLNLYAGVSPVRNLFDEFEDNQWTTAVYFRADYKVFQCLSARTNFNYYNNNDTLNKNIRGGLNLIYYFGN